MRIEETLSIYMTRQQPLYKLFANKLEELVCTILRANRVTPHSVTSREKSVNSLKVKILREGKEYDDPLAQVTDLAGVRIITYFPKDVDRVIPLLEKEFTVDSGNSVDKRKVADPSVFGYASVHLIAELTEARVRLPEYAQFRGLRCEIQVRTILQHAWAEIEHDIAYKSSEEVPFELRRQFASLAGLLEVADREFEQLRNEQRRVREQIERTIKRDDLAVGVNLDSLSLYLKTQHKETIDDPRKVGNLVTLLHLLKIDSLQAAHELLTPSALKRADEGTRAIAEVCPSAGRCLLRYFVALGESAKLPRKELADLVHCPALANLEEYKKRRESTRSQHDAALYQPANLGGGRGGRGGEERARGGSRL